MICLPVDQLEIIIRNYKSNSFSWAWIEFIFGAWTVERILFRAAERSDTTEKIDFLLYFSSQSVSLYMSPVCAAVRKCQKWNLYKWIIILVQVFFVKESKKQTIVYFSRRRPVKTLVTFSPCSLLTSAEQTICIKYTLLHLLHHIRSHEAQNLPLQC